MGRGGCFRHRHGRASLRREHLSQVKGEKEQPHEGLAEEHSRWPVHRAWPSEILEAGWYNTIGLGLSLALPLICYAIPTSRSPSLGFVSLSERFDDTISPSWSNSDDPRAFDRTLAKHRLCALQIFSPKAQKTKGQSPPWQCPLGKGDES